MSRFVLVLALLLAAAPAAADTLAPRETAHPGEKGDFSVGVFNPIRWTVSDDLRLQVHPLLTLLGGIQPVVLWRHAEVGGWTLSGEYALGFPTPGMRFSQGFGLASFFFPRWEMDESTEVIGWFLVPRAGLVASREAFGGATVTLRADAAVGIPLGQNDAFPVGSTFAPLELMFAPMLTGYRIHVGAGYDREVLSWLRARLQLHAHLTGSQPEGFPALSPFYLEGYAGVDMGSARTRFTLGLKWYNWDQHATRLTEDADGFTTRKHVRSNDFLPTIDVIFSW